MSSSRISYNRKRRSDDEYSSSDSDEDAPPVKRSRMRTREPNFKDIITNKFHDLVKWIYQLPVPTYEKENMLKNTIDIHVPVEIEDDEDDVDVVEIDSDDDDPVVDKVLSHSSDKSEHLLRNTISIPIITNPLSTSTPFYKDIRTSRGRTLESLSRRPVNGCNSTKTSPRSKRLSLQHQKLRHNQYGGPICSRRSDVEIILDSREMPSEESDDLEIVSEIPNTKPSRRLTRQTVSQTDSKFSLASKEFNGTSPSGIMNGKAASSEQPRTFSLSKSFTAHEVIRLQEKAHYQLILDKMIGTTPYHPAASRKPAEIKVELIEDDEPVKDSCLKKESFEKPVNEFLQKYYKPCNFKHCETPKENSDIELFTVEDDDDIQVLETDSTLYKPSADCYRPKSRKRLDIFSSEWINDLKKSITLETEQRLRSVAAQEEKIEKIRKRRDANISKEKLLRGQLSSSEADEEAFPELTPDMEARIDSIFQGPQNNEVLSTFKDCSCDRNDLITLSGLNWLNDSVINFYLALVKERNENHPEYLRVHYLNSFFYASYKKRGANGVCRWTRKLLPANIFQFDLVFVPVHLGMHWALCVIDNRTKKLKYYDSMLGTDDTCLKDILEYLVAEHQHKLKQPLDPNIYSLECVKDIPQQMNGSDCGMFTLKYAEYLSRNVNISFSQEHMQYFRRRMVIEILEKKLF